jgi:membrane protein insertase Oxa1/YidC/SpoIIIJ
MPKPAEKKKLRDMFGAAAKGEQVDQQDMMAATTGKMIYLFPFMTFMIALALPAAVVLYYATTSSVAVIQQWILLRRDDIDLEKVASERSKKPRKKSFSERMMEKAQAAQNAQNTTSADNNPFREARKKAETEVKNRAKNAKTAEIVTRPAASAKASKGSAGQGNNRTVVRRIKAK